MSDFTALPIPYVPIADKAAEVRAAIDAARLSAANSFGGLQKLAIPGPFATDAEASTGGVPDDNLYYRSDGTVRAASHISLDLAFALDKTLTARTGPTPTFSRASSGLFTNANGILVGKTAGTTTSITPSTTANGTSVTVTVASGSVVGWLVGQSVSLIVDTDGGNDNDASELWLVGTIVSMTATELVFTVTSASATAGSATAWTLGYRGARFDHDPATVLLAALAVENLMLNSGNVSLMSRTDVPVAISQTGGPLGSYYTLGVNATNSFHIYRNSGVTPAASASSMMWVLAKRGTARYLRMGGGSASTFDWDTLTFSSISTTHSAGNPVAVGDGWYWIPILRGPTDLIDLAPSSSSGVTFSYNETANVTVEVAAIQVSRSRLLQNVAPTYYPTTSAFYGPSSNYDPNATGVCKGLLIEESRSNIYLRSDNFADSNWTKTRLSIQTDATIAPDGAMTADKLIEDTTVSNTHTIGSTVTPPATPHTLSVFAKKGERDFIVLRLGGTNDFFNLNTGVAITDNNSPKITNFGNGWYRCTVTSSAGTQGSFQLSADGITSSYTGDGTSGIYLWGAQLEAGAFATSYIPTTSGTAARSADVCSIIGTDFSSFYNQSEGTLFAAINEFRRGSSSSDFVRARKIGGSFNRRIRIGAGGNKTGSVSPVEFIVGDDDGVLGYAVTASSITSQFKSALAYKADDARACVDAFLAAADDTPTVMPTALDELVMSAGTGAGHHIARITYFRKRLSNAKLQTLTTP